MVPSGIDEQGVDHGGLLLRLSHLPAADATQRRLELVVGEGEVVAPQLKAPVPPRRRVGAAPARSCMMMSETPLPTLISFSLLYLFHHYYLFHLFRPNPEQAWLEPRRCRNATSCTAQSHIQRSNAARNHEEIVATAKPPPPVVEVDAILRAHGAFASDQESGHAINRKPAAAPMSESTS